MARDFIHFDEIDKYGPQSYERSYVIPTADLGRDEVESLGEVSITANARKGELSGEYVVEGMVRYTADLRCSRCVEPFPFANASPFHIRYRARPEGAGEPEAEEVEITADELDIELYAERSLSLREMAVEQIQLTVPMKPLCDESCLGLCPTCGANRSREACSCETSVVDERWGALQGIREQLLKKDQ